MIPCIAFILTSRLVLQNLVCYAEVTRRKPCENEDGFREAVVFPQLCPGYCFTWHTQQHFLRVSLFQSILKYNQDIKSTIL